MGDLLAEVPLLADCIEARRVQAICDMDKEIIDLKLKFKKSLKQIKESGQSEREREMRNVNQTNLDIFHKSLADMVLQKCKLQIRVDAAGDLDELEALSEQRAKEIQSLREENVKLRWNAAESQRMAANAKTAELMALRRAWKELCDGDRYVASFIDQTDWRLSLCRMNTVKGHKGQAAQMASEHSPKFQSTSFFTPRARRTVRCSLDASFCSDDGRHLHLNNGDTDCPGHAIAAAKEKILTFLGPSHRRVGKPSEAPGDAKPATRTLSSSETAPFDDPAGPVDITAAGNSQRLSGNFKRKREESQEAAAGPSKRSRTGHSEESDP